MNDVPVTVSRTDFSDFEAMRNAVQDAPTDIVQLEPGQMTGTLTHLSVGTIGISSGFFSRSLRSRGILSERRWSFAMVFAAPALAPHCKMAPGDVMSHAPNHEHYLRHVGANHYADVFIEPNELFAFLDSQQPGAAEAAARQSSSVLNTDPAIAAVRAQNFQTLLAAIKVDGATMSATAADFFKRSILALMTAPMRNAVDYRGPRLPSAVALVREVDRYLMDAGNRPVHITELIERFNVHPRRLYRAFDEVLGIPPITFQRHKRLGDVHAALLRGGPDLMIKTIAREHGFLDYPRFAREYRQLFGERPSHTLRRMRK